MVTMQNVSQGSNGYAQGTAQITSGTFNVILQQAPVSGNLLVLCYISGADTTIPNISGISQSNVTWHKAVASPRSNCEVEIWYAVAGSSAGTTITVTVANGAGGHPGEIADVCEWNSSTGWAASPLDQTAVNYATSGSTPSDTGTITLTG